MKFFELFLPFNVVNCVEMRHLRLEVPADEIYKNDERIQEMYF